MDVEVALVASCITCRLCLAWPVSFLEVGQAGSI